MKLKTFIFMGRSGCGKGTQVELLEKDLADNDPNTPVLSLETGARFREFLKGDTLTNKLAREISEAGGLQPAFLAINMWSLELINKFKGNEHLIVDGTPRKLREAHVLEDALEFYKREEVYIVYLNVTREWSKERLLKRGRADDNIEEIEKRLDWFESDVKPAIEYYKDNSKYKFIDVNGERSIGEIHEDIKQKVFG